MSRFFHFCLWVSGISLCCLFWGFVIEPAQLKTRKHVILSADWVGEPMDIVFLSDLHIAGPHVPPERIEKIVARINKLSPDLVLIGGDFVDGSGKRENRSQSFLAELDEGLSRLGKIDARFGVHTVLGNHDALHGNTPLRQTLQGHGVSVYENKSNQIDGRFCLVGFGDEWYGKPSITAYADCENTQPVIAFMHNPDTFALLPENTVIAMAGHTHGGQINLPFLGRRITLTDLGPPFAYGLKKFRRRQVYITSGIGTSRMSARFRSPPEIVIFRINPN